MIVAVFLLVLLLAALGSGNPVDGSHPLILLVNEPLYVTPEAKTIPLAVAVLPVRRGAPVKVQIRVETVGGQLLARAETPVGPPLSFGQTRDLEQLMSVRQAALSGGAFRLPGAEGSESRAVEAELERFQHALEQATIHLEIPSWDLLQRARPGDHVELVVDAEYTHGGRPFLQRVRVRAHVRTLPVHPDWYAGDAHVHAAEFDAGTWLSKAHRIPLSILRTTADSRGHHWLYMTEHTDNIDRYGFDRYWQQVRDASLPHLAFLPGGEVQVRYDRSCDSGHLTVFGIRSLAGLRNNAECDAQVVIDGAAGNHPDGLSSGSIAHPLNSIMAGLAWNNWTVRGQRGMELMNGIQIYCDPESLPVRKWVAELERTAAHALAEGWFPSARAVTDVHTSWHWPSFLTWAHLPGETAFTADTWEHQYRRLTEAFYYGRTVASSQGDLAFFVINGEPVGSILRVPEGEPLQFTLWSQAVNLGQRHRITVELFEGTTRIYQMQSPVRPAGATPWELSFTREAGLESTYYRLQARFEFFDVLGLVDREEWAYTSPIYVGRLAEAGGSQWPSPPGFALGRPQK